MHHEGKDSHLGGTAVVQLDSLLVLEVESTSLLRDGGKVGTELLARLFYISLHCVDVK